jgi:hypothetical protein
MAKKSKNSSKPISKGSKTPAKDKDLDYQLGYAYGQLGNAIKAALADKSPAKGGKPAAKR